MTFFYKHFLIDAFLAGIFTALITSLGAAVIFLFKKVNESVLNSMMGIAAGVMISASFFSLITPALDIANNLNMCSWLVLSIGFLFGGLFLYAGDTLFKSNNKKNSMLIFSITLHNIPEGLAVGVAYGLLKYNLPGTTFVSAILITLGIGLQNFPEGTAVALPVFTSGRSAKKAFLISSLTGIVEPLSAVIGALLAIKVQYVMPFLLSFAAGAMIYVVVCEIVPECNNSKQMSLFTIIGFVIMMILDISLG